MGIKLFIAEPTGRCRVVARRYEKGACGADGASYHNAEALVLDDAPVTPRDDTGYHESYLRLPDNDPHWPEVCECGFRFTDASDRQVNEQEWYEGPDGRKFAYGIGSWRAPVGAMIRAHWLDGVWPDNGCEPYRVELPNGCEWLTSQPSTQEGSMQNGPQWKVTGRPPLITVTPSILAHHGVWHGWIRNGELVDA